MFAKPEEMVLHRPHSYGGIGLHSVKYKALACYISTFMQTAANPNFRSSLLHQLLYRKHVLDEDDVPGVPAQLPPYLSQDLFNIIKKVKNESPLNITSLTEGDWSRLLTEDYVTMEFNFDSGRKEFRPCKAELACPTTDWSLSWSLCRQQGIPPDLSSFLWKMLLDLLCTQERLHKMGASPSPLCKLCKQETGTLQHELLECSFNENIGQLLVHSIQSQLPSLTPEALLHLGLSDLEADMELPTTLLAAVTLSCIWRERNTSSRVRAYQVRSELEQTINLLRTTRLADAANKLCTMLYMMFN